jgi:hypothetical protein
MAEETRAVSTHTKKQKIRAAPPYSFQLSAVKENGKIVARCSAYDKQMPNKMSITQT